MCVYVHVCVSVCVNCGLVCACIHAFKLLACVCLC